MSVEARICEFALGPLALPDTARRAAERLLADTLKVGAAGGWSEDARGLDARAAPGPCRLLAGGQGEAAGAAFANGFAIHCLEWDPVHEQAVVHACSVVTAALLALSDRQGGSDREALVEAFAVGVEIAAGLGIAATGPMRFFRPATAGVIGAALAGARLLRLDDSQARSALGLAYSFAGGTMQAHAEGSIALPLQIGAAARSAVTAVDCACAGMVGPREALTGAFGYDKLIEPLDWERWLPGLGQRWLVEEVSLKPWPCGRASHGLLSAIGVGEVDVRELQTLTAYVPPLVQRLVGRRPMPGMTASYARLCGPYLGALMFDDGRIDPRRFGKAEVGDPQLLALAERITIDLDTNDDPNALSPQRFLFEDGEGMTDIRLENILGHPDCPMSPELAADRDALMAELALPALAHLFDDPLHYAEAPR